jgi:formiminotetrahydrofolate cyclodeaminase
VVEKGNPSAVTDAAVGALLAGAALQGGVFNVLVNLLPLDDKNTVKKMKKELQRLEAEANKTREKILARVKEKLNQP